MFVGTFAHAMLAMREVQFAGGGKEDRSRARDRRGLPPGHRLSIVVLVSYVDHIGQSLRVAALIELVGKDTRALVDRSYPDKGTPVAIRAGGRAWPPSRASSSTSITSGSSS